MAAFTLFQPFHEAVAEKVHNLGSDTLKIALTNSAPSSGSATLSQITQITSGGYAPQQASQVSSTQSGGTYTLVLDDVTFTSTSSMGPFQYAVLYNDTAASDELIGFYDLKTPITVATGNKFVLDFGSAGVWSAQEGTSAPAYQGPGDIATEANWKWWHGLRAFTLASIGANAIHLVRNDAATTDIVTVAGGGLDMTTLNAWMSGHTAKVDIIYDQTGNGRHIVQATDASRPSLTLSGLNGLPVVTFSGGQFLAYTLSLGANIDPPHAFSFVGRSNGPIAGSMGTYLEVPTLNTTVQANVGEAANEMLMAGSPGSISITANDDVFHAVQALWAATSTASELYVDGAQTTGDLTGGILDTDEFFWGGKSTIMNWLDGNLVEGGCYSGDLQSFKAALDTNQTDYWGPF